MDTEFSNRLTGNGYTCLLKLVQVKRQMGRRLVRFFALMLTNKNLVDNASVP
ncbi:hypothetical protein [Chryseobacterium indoltheticum]|uniref:hypothetical protein n=1 Tax=Chryseobacterium indoltheticum TaxID=254 RepID=UPI003F4944FD